MDFKLEVVPMPVADLDRAKHFYADQVGFAVDLDHRVDDKTRLIQLTPPGSGCSIFLGSGTDAEPGSIKRLQLVVDDVEAARELLAGRGVDISTIQHLEDGVWLEGKGGRWNSFAFFKDPDGNTWTLQERPTEG
ncbi:VOC family protein [Spirillospora sp. CA-294931]|uniref:VOC family protein n=1 Tax=Spirillospora sp. CA-294931 TaxID=3240042 RepID=UPI003D8C7CA6